MKRFASLDPFLDPTDWSFRMGRPIANEGFLRALLTHGTYDEYTFYLPDAGSLDRWTRQVHERFPDMTTRRRLRPSPVLRLANDLRQSHHSVFHQGDFTYFQPHLASIRSHIAPRLFPITGVTHSLDQPHMQTRFLQLALSGGAACDAVICTSEAARRAIENKFDEIHRLLQEAGAMVARPSTQTAVIPLGLDDAAYSAPVGSDSHCANREYARSALGISPNTTVYLSVGRLSLRTKCDWAPPLELIAEMRQRGEFNQAVLILAGGGGEGHRLLEQLVARLRLDTCVVLFPDFPPDMKSTLYTAADVYVSLIDNYQETFGISVIEAMAAGLPVIASDFDGYRDAVRQGVNGWSIPTLTAPSLPRDIDDIFGILDPSIARLYTAQMVALDLAALRSALRESANPHLRRPRSVQARAAAERYRWRRIIAEYEALWAELAATATSSPKPRANPALLAGDGMRAYLHYASAPLHSDDRLALTERGRALRKHPDLVIRYADVTDALDATAEATLLASLEGGPRTVAELAQRAPAWEFTLLWLIKHGAIEKVHR